MKACSRCSLERPRNPEYFGIDKRASDGLQSHCRECDRDAKRKDYHANIDKRRSDLRDRYRKDPKANIRRATAWNEAHPERRKKIIREAYYRNPEKSRADRSARRSRKLQAEGTHTGSDIRTIFERQSGKCFYCEIPLEPDYHVDHMLPLARGGSDWPSNLCCACPPCNLRKGCMTAQEFLISRISRSTRL